METIEVVVSVPSGLGRTGVRFGRDQNSLMRIDVSHTKQGKK